MGLSEFFHFESECEKCGEKCHFVMQAKLPGSYMNDYGIGDRLADEVLKAFEKGEKQYYSKVLGVERDKIIEPNNCLPSFTILPTHIESHCNTCGRNDVTHSIAVVIEEGVFTQVLYDGQRKGSIIHGGFVVPELVLEDDELRKQLADAVQEYFEGPSEETETKPCPYCGQPLRTPKAKQCFECHMDWHDPSNIVKHNVDKSKRAEKEISEKEANKAIREALGLDD